MRYLTLALQQQILCGLLFRSRPYGVFPPSSFIYPPVFFFSHLLLLVLVSCQGSDKPFVGAAFSDTLFPTVPFLSDVTDTKGTFLFFSPRLDRRSPSETTSPPFDLLLGVCRCANFSVPPVIWCLSYDFHTWWRLLTIFPSAAPGHVTSPSLFILPHLTRLKLLLPLTSLLI